MLVLHRKSQIPNLKSQISNPNEEEQAVTIVTDVLRQSVVVFSQNYLPMSRVNIKRAIILLVTGKAQALDFSIGNGYLVRSPSTSIHVPEQIRLTFGNRERVWKVPPVNRREVLRGRC